MIIKTNIKLKSWLIIAGLLVLVGCESANDSARPKAKSEAGRPGKKSVKTTPVELSRAKTGTAASYYVTTSTLEPSSDAKINARTSGVVRELLSEEGDDVKVGDVLLLLEDDDQQLRLKQARQRLSASEREYQRLNKMRKAGAVSSNEWETAKNAYESSQTELELAQLALSYTRISAPFDGRVVWREVDLGEHVGVGNLLYRIMAIKPLLLRVHIPANRVGFVARGQEVELNIDSVKSKVFGVVELVSPIVDPSTGTIKVTVKLENYPIGVRPGDFTEIKMITNKRENALLIPTVAVIEERGQHYLYLAQNNKAVRRAVEVGYVVGDETEVLSGISIDDLVVIKGQRNLKQDSVLQVIETDSHMSDEKSQLIDAKTQLQNSAETKSKRNRENHTKQNKKVRATNGKATRKST